MNTDEIVAQLLLWSDLRYVTVEDFDAYVAKSEAELARLCAKVDQQAAALAELESRVAALESLF